MGGGWRGGGGEVGVGRRELRLWGGGRGGVLGCLLADSVGGCGGGGGGGGGELGCLLAKSVSD